MLKQAFYAVMLACLGTAASAQLSYHTVGEGYVALERTGDTGDAYVNLIALTRLPGFEGRNSLFATGLGARYPNQLAVGGVEIREVSDVPCHIIVWFHHLNADISGRHKIEWSHCGQGREGNDKADDLAQLAPRAVATGAYICQGRDGERVKGVELEGHAGRCALDPGGRSCTPQRARFEQANCQGSRPNDGNGAANWLGGKTRSVCHSMTGTRPGVMVGVRAYYQRSEGRREIVGLRAICQEIALR